MRLARPYPPRPLALLPRPERAFTVVEIIIVVLIMSIISVIAMGAVSTFEANQRADRAAREALALFRFARNLAMTSGRSAKVQLVSSPAAATLTVYHKNAAGNYTTAYATSLNASRTMAINFATARELAGTTLAPAGTIDIEYNVLGTCSYPATFPGTITFSYAGKSKAITLRSVGDPLIP